MLSVKEIDDVFYTLESLQLGYEFGYAGSYARGQARESSDLDIVVSGTHVMSGDDYLKLYHVLKEKLTVSFDIVDLAALKEDDARMDEMLINMGLSVNDASAYKTIKKEIVWMHKCH